MIRDRKGTRAGNVARSLKKTAGSTSDRRQESNNGADETTAQASDGKRSGDQERDKHEDSTSSVGWARRRPAKGGPPIAVGETTGREKEGEGRVGKREGKRERRRESAKGNAKAPSPVERAKERAEVRQRKGPKRSKDTDEPVKRQEDDGRRESWPDNDPQTRRGVSAKEHERNRSQ